MKSKKKRKALKRRATKGYKALHKPSEYLKFMNQYECTLTRLYKGGIDHPYCWGLFTVKSQQITGDCVEECLDIAMK